MSKQWLKLSLIAVGLIIGGWALYPGVNAQQQDQEAKKVQLPQHPPAPGDGKNMVVQLCDGTTNVEVPGVGPNERLSPEQAQVVSDQLMNLWLAKQSPEAAAAWLRATQQAQQRAATQKQQPEKPPPGDQRTTRQGPQSTAPQAPAAPPAAKVVPKKSAPLPKTGRAPGDTTTDVQPNDFSERDFSIWKKEVEREIKYGDQIFHDDKLVGSTNGVACAMCHPHAANTHPETYPKFQIQLRRVALLRDMINWCIENPSRGKKLDADDPKMRALEAYIMAQRKGVAMEYGKH